MRPLSQPYSPKTKLGNRTIVKVLVLAKPTSKTKYLVMNPCGHTSVVTHKSLYDPAVRATVNCPECKAKALAAGNRENKWALKDKSRLIKKGSHDWARRLMAGSLQQNT